MNKRTAGSTVWTSCTGNLDASSGSAPCDLMVLAACSWLLVTATEQEVLWYLVSVRALAGLVSRTLVRYRICKWSTLGIVLEHTRFVRTLLSTVPKLSTSIFTVCWIFEPHRPSSSGVHNVGFCGIWSNIWLAVSRTPTASLFILHPPPSSIPTTISPERNQSPNHLS